jgi:lysozyme
MDIERCHRGADDRLSRDGDRAHTLEVAPRGESSDVRQRVAILLLTLSASAFVGILQREGYVERAAPPVVGDVPTNGFGTTTHEDGTPLKFGEATTPVRAVARALADANQYERAVKRCVHVPLYQAEYDLYVNLTYNIGPTGFCDSTIVKRLNARQYADACEAILMWKKFHGFDCSTPGNKVCAGLWTDRLKVHAQCVAAQDS